MREGNGMDTGAGKKIGAPVRSARLEAEEAKTEEEALGRPVTSVPGTPIRWIDKESGTVVRGSRLERKTGETAAGGPKGPADGGYSRTRCSSRRNGGAARGPRKPAPAEQECAHGCETPLVPRALVHTPGTVGPREVYSHMPATVKVVTIQRVHT